MAERPSLLQNENSEIASLFQPSLTNTHTHTHTQSDPLNQVRHLFHETESTPLLLILWLTPIFFSDCSRTYQIHQRWVYFVTWHDKESCLDVQFFFFLRKPITWDFRHPNFQPATFSFLSKQEFSSVEYAMLLAKKSILIYVFGLALAIQMNCTSGKLAF